MEYHYVYQITFLEVPHIYYGVRTSKCLPEEDTKYMGSPVTYKHYWKDYTPVKTILVSDFETRADAGTYENDLIKKQWDKDISLSLNDNIGGVLFPRLGRPHSEETLKKLRKPRSEETREKMRKPKSESHRKNIAAAQKSRTPEHCKNLKARIRRGESHPFYGRKHTEEHRKYLSDILKGKPRSEEVRAKLSELNKQRCLPYYFISPDGVEYSGVGLIQFCEDNELNVGYLYDKLFTGKALHIKGWTTSWENHELYLYYYNMRGFSITKANYICVKWMDNGKRKNKTFTSLEKAIIFRDNLEKELGFTFYVNTKRKRHYPLPKTA